MSDFTKPAGGETFEQTRHNYEIKARMEESDDTDYAGVMIKPNQQGKNSASAKKDKGNTLNDMLMMNNSLAAIENMMVAQYGEDFDLHLAAKFLDDETYKRIASIQDIDERRQAVAQAIQEGIKNGSIDKDAVEEFNPDFGEWAEKRIENSAEAALNREQELTQKTDNNTNLTQDSDFEKNAMAVFGPASP